MTPLTLSEMTDSEIEAAVAEHVEGYRPVYRDAGVGYPPTEWCKEFSKRHPEVSAIGYVHWPRYLTDANAVLPLLNAGWYWVCDTGGRLPQGGMSFTVRYGRGIGSNGNAVEATFNRAACYALLRSVPGLCKGER